MLLTWIKCKTNTFILLSPCFLSAIRVQNSLRMLFYEVLEKWCHGVVVITTVQLHSTMPELRFYTGWHPACGMSEVCNSETIQQWSQLQIKQNPFHWSTILQ